MGRTGGEITRQKILVTAERLFAEKGFDGTGIQDIAAAAGVNKALIYYHFKNKKDLVDSLFKQTLEEMFTLQGTADEQLRDALGEEGAKEKVSRIISFLEKKRQILSVMLMEGLKLDTDGYKPLFECAKMIIEKNVNDVMHRADKQSIAITQRDELLMHEFFTGFLPIVFFALFKDRWVEFFGCDRNEAVNLFMKVFSSSHIRHPKE